jgi:hypothetical protein
MKDCSLLLNLTIRQGPPLLRKAFAERRQKVQSYIEKPSIIDASVHIRLFHVETAAGTAIDSLMHEKVFLRG